MLVFFKEKIGEGCSGVVYGGEFGNLKNKVAIKVIDNIIEKENEKAINFSIECENPFLVRYFNSFIDNNLKKKIVVMEFFEGTDLRKYIDMYKKYKQFVPEEVYFLCYDYFFFF
jgi:serine/threonine protein kinase